MTSPPSMLIRARKVAPLIESRRKRTLPSHITTLAPPEWKLNVSSFGPQLRTVHGQAGGPPVGVALLLMSWSTLYALSGSAQAQHRRPFGLRVFSVVGELGMASLRRASSAMAMVLLVPSVMAWIRRGPLPTRAQKIRGPLPVTAKDGAGSGMALRGVVALTTTVTGAL